MAKLEILGLVAGNGQFPFLFAQQAKLKKIKVVAAAVKGDTSWGLQFFVRKICWVGPGELEKLFSKVKSMVGLLNSAREDNFRLMEKVKELEKALSDYKIDLSGKSNELLLKDKEISELKTKILEERKNKVSLEEKQQLKTRIKDLMVRLDSHLEQKASNNF